MTKPELLYIFDTLCGWCYGGTPIIAQAKASLGDILDITLLHGGLFTGGNASSMPEMRPIALEHDKRIQKLTGQPFSEAYIKNIVMNDDVVHDSTPTALAHQVIKHLAPETALEFLQAAQHARFVEGKDLTSWLAYVPAVKRFGLSPKQFFDGFYNDPATRQAMDAEFRRARSLMNAAKSDGFPTIFFIKEGKPTVIPHGHLLSAPKDIVHILQVLIEQSS